jgi:hypothetical protein
VESNWPSAGRWVTPDPGKLASESDFDSAGSFWRISSLTTRLLATGIRAKGGMPVQSLVLGDDRSGKRWPLYREHPGSLGPSRIWRHRQGRGCSRHRTGVRTCAGRCGRRPTGSAALRRWRFAPLCPGPAPLAGASGNHGSIDRLSRPNSAPVSVPGFFFVAAVSARAVPTTCPTRRSAPCGLRMSAGTVRASQRWGQAPHCLPSV